MERNLLDGISVANIAKSSPGLIPGGGAAELSVSKILWENSKNFRNNNFYNFTLSFAA